MKSSDCPNSIVEMLTKIGALLALSLICLVGGCAENPTERAQRLEPMLAAAGFKLHPADTAERRDSLKARTPLKVRYSVRDDGKVYYWFADPVVCQCLYVGSQSNYQKYEQIRLQQLAAEQAQAAASMNEDAALQEQTDFVTWPMPMW